MTSRHPSSNTTIGLGSLTGEEIISLINKNYVIRIFQRLRSSLRRQKMSRRRSLMLKMDLLNEYSHPKPFPKDIFLRLPSGSPDQSYVMLGQKGTGKPM